MGGETGGGEDHLVGERETASRSKEKFEKKRKKSMEKKRAKPLSFLANARAFFRRPFWRRRWNAARSRLGAARAEFGPQKGVLAGIEKQRLRSR